MKSFRNFLLEANINLKESDIPEFSKRIAEFYEQSREPTQRITASYTALRQHIHFVYAHIISNLKINVVPVETDPYSSDVEMVNDVHQNKTLKVYTGHSEHPIFSPKENVEFRVIHDYYAHFVPNRRHLQTGSIKGSSLLGHGFNFMGELQAYDAHQRFSSGAPIIHAALFSEVIGQVCYYQHFGGFPDPQKIVDYTEMMDINRLDMSSFK